MNARYVNVIKETFPQAKIIIDRFHIVQLISRSMNQTRVRIMNRLRTTHGEDMKTSIKTIKKHLPYIKHSLMYSYNDDRIDGINNKIKVWNRVEYGYRNFHNFKKRIILHF